MSPLIHTPTMREARVRQDGTRVLLIVDGRTILDVDHAAALELGRGLIAKAKRAEEIASAERIAYDQAVLLRAGAPVGLTNHPAIQALARGIARFDRRLRRYLPGGVPSRERFGTPTVTHAPPPGR